MNILITVTYYRPHWTGLTQYAARLAEGLANHNHRVRVLTTKHESTLSSRETISGVDVTRVPSWFRLSRSHVAPMLLWHFCKLLLKTDVVIVYLPFLEALPATILARLCGKKIYLIHNGDLVLPAGWVNRIIEHIFFFTTKYAMHLADGIVIQTEDYARHSSLLCPFEHKWHVVLPLYTQVKLSKRTLPELARLKKSGKKLIGFSGRLVEEKGIDYLLEALPLVQKSMPDAHLVFAGDYRISYENFFQRIEPLLTLYGKSITLLGLINDASLLNSFYQSCDVLAQPSRSDCFPSSLVEAIRAGTPAVVADIPGARWIVQETGMGVVVDAGSPHALARGIIDVLNNRKKYVAKHQRARNLFDYGRTLQNYERLFTS